MNKLDILKQSLALVLVTVISSCSGDWLDVNDNPNSPIEPDLELLIPSVQIATAHVMADRLDAVGVLGQNMEGGVSQYTLGSDAGINLAYEDFFVDALVNAERVIKDAPLNDPPLTTHSGIAKLLKAYVFHVMVDLWGTVPFDESLQGAEGPDAPMWEDGAVVYPKIIALIDEAIAELNLGGVSPQSDILYGGSAAQWIKFANTLKLKMALNLDDASIAQAAINAGVMESNADDADFEFGTGLAPENRHRMHQLHYTGGVKTFYMSDVLMFKMYKGYGEEGQTDAVDPRMRYYFYRQLPSVDGNGNLIAEPFAAAVATGKVVPDDFPCFGYAARHTNPASWTAVNCAYGYVGDGYTGRDHGDASGTPNDGGSRTTFGIYPIGGLFDDNQGKTVQQSDLSRGGIYPIFTNAMAKFMQAEAALRLNVGGLDARKLLEEGVRASIEDVMSFGVSASNFEASLAPSAGDIETYVSAVLAKYDAASTNNAAGVADSQLDVVMDQWYIANFGNNTESFTSLRRTKLPFVRPANNATGRMSIIPSNTYPRRLPFPPSELATNPNAPDPDQVVWFQTPIFWDDNNYPTRF
ncbi:MAG: SusD/RagB family nutrient-binding outer membrane lipoprotein [Cyclobacteriaceae bacterium]